MQYDNDAKQLKYRVLKIVAENEFKGTLEENLEKIPYDVIPGPLPEFRCCIFVNGKSSGSVLPPQEEKRFPIRRIRQLWVCFPLPARVAPSAVLL